MLRATLIFALVASAVAKELVATVDIKPDPTNPKFVAQNVTGYLKLVQADKDSPVVITGKIYNLNSTSSHGFHIHAKGDITSGCLATGPHFNPENKNHGAPGDNERHIGDLGNIVTDDKGVATINVTDKVISLASGSNSVVNLAFVIHSGTDDLGTGNDEASKKTGNAGDRWACGQIKLNSAMSTFNAGYIVLLSVAAVLFTMTL